MNRHRDQEKGVRWWMVLTETWRQCPVAIMSKRYWRALFSTSVRSFPVSQLKIKIDRDVSPRVTEKASYLLLLQLQQGSLCHHHGLVQPSGSHHHPALPIHRLYGTVGSPVDLPCHPLSDVVAGADQYSPWHPVAWDGLAVALSFHVGSFMADYLWCLLPNLGCGKELVADVSHPPCPSPFPATAPC